MTVAPSPSYQACSIKRPRRSKAEIDAIKTAIRNVVGEDPPMTVRQVFYQLVVRGVIEKSEKEYQQTVIRLLTEMRLSRQIPFQWIVDESRRRRVTETYDTISEALEATAKFYRRNALRESDAHVEIWLEKDALAGALWDVVSDYDVPLLVSRGMQSLTLLHGTAEEIYRAAHLEKATYIYQFGDHDPSGVLIPKTIEKRLTELCEQMDVPRPFVERAALTEAHIDEYDLPTRPTKRDGNTHANSFDGDSVELDALPPKVLRDLVRETIELHISPAKLAVLRTAEGSERESLTRWAGQFDGGAE